MVTKKQLCRIHILLKQVGKQEHKAALVFSFSNSRCISSKELSYQEAQNLIGYLEQQLLVMKNGSSPHHTSANQMRRKLISICHNMKYELESGKVDMKRLDEWCRNKSYLKKPLMEYSYDELPKLVSQFQQVYVSFINKNVNV
jgi:hypothetical protein